MGDTKGGAFDIPGELAREWLHAPLNPNGRPNADVLKPWVNGLDVTRRPRDMWIIDFGWTMSEPDAALYEAPFVICAAVTFGAARSCAPAARLRTPLVAARDARDQRCGRLCTGCTRYIATPTVAKHRFFIWLPRRLP